MMWKKKQFWGTVFAVALLAFCVKDVKLSELELLYHRVNLLYILLSLICSVAFVAFKALRWKLMVAPQKIIPVYRSITLYSAGQVLNILMPALTGQLGRVILFARKEGLRKTFVFSTIVLEILFDAITLVLFLLLTSLAFAFPDEYRSLSWVVAGITLALLAGLYVFLHYSRALEDLGRRCFRERRPGLYIGLKKFIRSFCKGIELLRSSQHLAGSLCISLVFWTTHMLVVYFLFKAFGFGLPIAAAAAVMIINTIALMVPITPGNAGTFEVAVSTSLVAFSVGRSDAVMFALALHIIDIIPMWIFGLAFLRSERMSLQEIQKEHQDEELIDHISEDGVLLDREKV
ncbi:MAG: flippase-like domain-containing protein [candidate division Zixibacteria bacterium]|nr:flippase-like domain-containing protein [candidate division Zixibacteria bacterium]